MNVKPLNVICIYIFHSLFVFFTRFSRRRRVEFVVEFSLVHEWRLSGWWVTFPFTIFRMRWKNQFSSSSRLICSHTLDVLMFKTLDSNFTYYELIFLLFICRIYCRHHPSWPFHGPAITSDDFRLCSLFLINSHTPQIHNTWIIWSAHVYGES